jgi:hypothetical protein
MESLFDGSDRASIMRRLDTLQASSPRQWGKMNPAQMLAHCSVAIEEACRDTPSKQMLLGRILGPIVKRSALGEKPFRRNSPTNPDFVVADERDFAKEQQRLAAAVERFCQRGPTVVDGRRHVFFGKMSSDEWGCLMYKHLDHHLRQFNA